MIARRLRPVLLLSLLAAAGQAADPIKIGQYGAFSGKEASFGTAAHKGVILAFEEANANGGTVLTPQNEFFFWREIWLEPQPSATERVQRSSR